MDMDLDEDEDIYQEGGFDYSPTSGSRWFFYKGRLFHLEKGGSEEPKPSERSVTSPFNALTNAVLVHRPMTLSCVCRNPKVLMEFLDLCKHTAAASCEQ